MTPIEQRLSASLKSLAAEAIPDEPVGCPWSELTGFQFANCEPPFTDAASAPSSWTNRIKGFAVLGVILGLAGAGTGIAAATGAFTPGPHKPSAYGSAIGLASPAGRAPGEITRFEGTGPAGVKLVVVSASSRPDSGCIGLIIATHASPARDVRTTAGSCTASGNVSNASPTLSTGSTPDYGLAQYEWTAPSGVAYVIWYGMAPRDATSVAEVSTVGGTVHNPLSSSRATPNGGFFALAIPKKLGTAVGFYNAAGEVITTVGGTAGHPAQQP
jgi:hypothetical protein